MSVEAVRALGQAPFDHRRRRTNAACGIADARSRELTLQFDTEAEKYIALKGRRLRVSEALEVLMATARRRRWRANEAVYVAWLLGLSDGRGGLAGAAQPPALGGTP